MSKFNKGDRIKVTDLNNIILGFQIGDAAVIDVVIDLGGIGNVYAIRSRRINGVGQAFTENQIELLPPAFKAGDDAVVASRKYGHRFDIGEVVTIVRLSDEDGISAETVDEYDCEGRNHERWYLRTDELAAPEEVGYADNVIPFPAPRAFQIGDRVKTYPGLHLLPDGAEGVITWIENDRDGLAYEVTSDEVTFRQWLRAKEMDLVQPPERAHLGWVHQIGR